MRSISSSQKENILSMASNGLPTGHIASELGLGKSTIARVLQDLLPDCPIPSVGHPTKLSSTDQHCILLQIASGKVSNGVQATTHTNFIILNAVSLQTVRNLLKQHLFKAVTKKKKPLLKAVYKKKHLAFALKHENWTVEDWKRVVLSDETKINRIGSDGKQWVWKQVAEGLIERGVQSTGVETLWYSIV
ncbi:hypothetical protein ID866_10049 [Astraeus odoratus]|nr:hypothetical protein ID866_10049 [Astraeus odoratus]